MTNQNEDKSMGSCLLCGREALLRHGKGGLLTGIDVPDAIKLKDGSCLCGSCVLKLRVMYPLQYGFDEAAQKIITKDPLMELNGDEAIDADNNVVSYREDLRQQFGFYDAVFKADFMEETQGGFLQAPVVTVFGQVIYGSFYYQDEVTIHSGGQESKASLEAICKYNDKLPVSAKALKDWTDVDPATQTAENGYPCKLVIQAKGIKINPGDLIVKGGK